MTIRLFEDRKSFAYFFLVHANKKTEVQIFTHLHPFAGFMKFEQIVVLQNPMVDHQLPKIAHLRLSPFFETHPNSSK